MQSVVKILVLLCLCVPALAQSPPVVVSDAAHQQFVFAYRLLQRGENNLAATAFDEYLGKFPNDEKRHDALYFRALLARTAGENERAAALLEKAGPTTIVPEHTLQLLRGQVLVDLARFGQASAALEKVKLESLDPPLRATALYLRGIAYRGLNNLPAAAAQLEAAAAIDSPLRARALLDLARVQALLEQTPAAIATLQKSLALNDGETAAEAARLGGDLNYKLSQYAQAIDLYRRVLTQHASSAHAGPAAVGLLWAQLGARQYREMLASYEQFRTQLPAAERLAAMYLAGSAQQELGEHAEAAALFEAALNAGATPLADKLLYKLAVSHFELGQFEAMDAAAQRLRSEHTQSELVHDAEFLLAAAETKRGQAGKGQARLTAIVDQGPQHPYYAPALLQRARLQERGNDLAGASADYRRYVETVRQAKFAGYEPATVQDAALRLVDLEFRQNRFQESLDAAQALIQLPVPGGLDASIQQESLYRRALAMIKLQQFAPAAEALSQFLAEHGQSRFAGEAHYYRGLLLMSTDQPDEAVKDLTAAAGAAQLPPPLRLNALRLVSVRQREKGQSAEAAQTLQAMEKISGAGKLAEEEQLWMARHLLDAGEPKGALRYLKPLLADTAMAGTPQGTEVRLVAALALRDLKDFEASAQTLREVISGGHGWDAPARLELARTLVAGGKLEDGLGEYAGLISSEQAALGAAACYESAEAHRLLARERELASDHAGTQHHRNEAWKLLKRVVLIYSDRQLSPLPELAHVALTELGMEMRNDAAAMAEAQELMSKYADSPYATYGRAVAALQQHKRGDALFLLKKLREQELDPRLSKRVEAQLRFLEGA